MPDKHTCPACNGSGYCANCDGTGYENDKPGETPVPCEDCRTSGLCPQCHDMAKVDAAWDAYFEESYARMEMDAARKAELDEYHYRD